MDAEWCVKYYKRQAQVGFGAYLPVFEGRGFGQLGHGWFSNIWSNYLYPHILSPLVKDIILPKLKRTFTDRVVPNLSRSVGDIKRDLSQGIKPKESFIKRGKEAWKRISTQDGTGAWGRTKRRRRSTF